jgi:hypothetical protein
VKGIALSLVALVVVLALASAAFADFGTLGYSFGRLGASKPGVAAPPAPPCSGTGPDFADSCNSQYITLF